MYIKKCKKGILGYRIFSRAYFHLPFLTVYLLMLGYSIVLISFIMSVYGMSICIYSIIEKKLHKIEYISVKCFLICSEMVKIIGLLIFVLWNGKFIALIIGQVLLGVGYGMAAGKDTLLIRKYIKDVDFQAKSNSYMFLSVLCAGLAGSILFNIKLIYPFVASLFTSVIAILFCGDLPSQDSGAQVYKSFEIKNPLLIGEKQSVLRYSLLRGIVLTLFSGFLPIYFWKNLNLPVFGFILILSAYTISGRISSQYIVKLFQKKGMETGRVLDVLLLCSLLSFYSGQMCLPTILLGIVSGMVRPVCINRIRQEIVSSAIEKMELYYSVINFILLLVGGVLYQYFSFAAVLLFFVIVWLIYMLLSLGVLDRHTQAETSY